MASFHGKCLLKLQEKSIDLLKSLAIILPQNAKEGSILKYSNGTFEIDSELEKEVSERIKQKMDNLWNN